jgi:hypothetical protein
MTKKLKESRALHTSLHSMVFDITLSSEAIDFGQHSRSRIAAVSLSAS